jgi:hypothetical protein
LDRFENLRQGLKGSKLKTMAAITVTTLLTVSVLASCDKQTTGSVAPVTIETPQYKPDPYALIAEALEQHLKNQTTTTQPRQIQRQTVDAGPDKWDRLAQCECGGNWGCNTGNGFYGGLQFAASSWTGFGGTEFAPMAHLATREQQIVVAENILNRMGWRAWPACARKFGWL